MAALAQAARKARYEIVRRRAWRRYPCRTCHRGILACDAGWDSGHGCCPHCNHRDTP